VVPVLKNDPKKSEELLRRALDTVPFYRDNWKRYDPGSGTPADRALRRHAGAHQG
jgi:hypothetical protein